MITPLDASHETLVARARAGDEGALGNLLDSYRGYLRLVARSTISMGLRLQVDTSDLVQETFLKAARDFPRFAGSQEPELAAWLRTILVRSMANLVRHHRSQGRDHRRGVSLEAWLEQSGRAAHEALAMVSSPGSHVARRERAVLLAQALDGLRPHYREVLILRHLEHLPFDRVAERMGRSSVSTRKLWSRAFRALRVALGGDL